MIKKIINERIRKFKTSFQYVRKFKIDWLKRRRLIVLKLRNINKKKK